ncbi:hypothetical protein ACSTI9_00690, partial [Vibrio parahaemolyticus]
KVTGSAHVSVSNTSWSSLSFTQSDIDNGVIKQTDTRNYTQSLVTSALGNLSLNVQAGPLSLGIPTGITAAVANTLGGVAAPLDAVVYSLP